MTTASGAWLETINGERLPFSGTCTIGRDAVNSVVVVGEKISRRHALIHSQEGTEFWLVDLGSRNGTLRNSRPIKQPTRLRSGDTILVGSVEFKFRADPASLSQKSPDIHAALAETVATQRISNVWLLIVDVIDFTALTQRVPAEELTRQLGSWLLQCSDLVESSGGCVDKYVGDGFLAYWDRSSVQPVKFIASLNDLARLQKQSSLPFRWILHCASLQLGVSRFRNDSLVGKEINFTYRMEKIAGTLRLPRLLSEPAAKSIQSNLPTRAVGDHAVKGFEGRFQFFTL